VTRWTRASIRGGCAGVLLLLYAPLATANFTGPVVSVLDGDTIEVLHNTHPERVRLSGIDWPEKGQGYGNNAKQATSAGTPHRPISAQLITSPSRASRLAAFFELP
jgi:micrococcal nuclease